MRGEKMGATSQKRQTFHDYDGFIEKFKPKKTTDDCYTPEIVYDAVADWCAAEYGIDRSRFVRPFYPGGSYVDFDYPEGCAVVDNPPFSMLGEIIKFYYCKEIPFFLFAPTLSGLVRYSDYCTAIPTGVAITYENGAEVPTSFVTNMDPHEIRARTVPELYAAVKAANDKNRKQAAVTLPKYVYPPNVLTSAQMYPLARVGIALTIPRKESMRISNLDSMKMSGKSIFGCGWLLSDAVTAEREKAEREKAEREKAEREKAERWQLSEREQRWIAILGGNADGAV